MDKMTNIIKSERGKKYCTLLIVYLSLFLDNVLLTVVVPIIPDYLHSKSLLLVAREESVSPIFSRLPQYETQSLENPNCIRNSSNTTNYEFIQKNIETEEKIDKSSLDKGENEGLGSQIENHEKVIKINSNTKIIPNDDLKKLTFVSHFLGRPKPKRSAVIKSNVQNQADDNNHTTTGIDIINKGYNNVVTTLGEMKSTQKNKASKINKLKTFESETLNTSTKKTKLSAGKENNEINGEDANAVLSGEKVTLGVLLSLKALVQLVANPMVSSWTSKVGYFLPVLIGNLNLLIASLLFACGGSAWTLGLARAIQGLASACIGVAGLCLVADAFTNDATRSKAMGVILGSVALGVLVGYPFGGITYQLTNKAAPFLILSVFIVLVLLLQIIVMDLTKDNQGAQVLAEVDNTGCLALMKEKAIAGGIVAIFFTTGAMAALEPCLPLWLMAHFKPEKWQLGTVFVPDSLGYLLATNMLGGGARALGRQRVAISAVGLVGVAAILIPFARSLAGLTIPHATLGIALGACDAAVVPALAGRARLRLPQLCCLLQTASSAAYFIAPLMGGTLSATVGFPATMRLIGVMNLLYAVVLWWIFKQDPLDDQFTEQPLEESEMSDMSERLATTTFLSYRAFQDSE